MIATAIQGEAASAGKRRAEQALAIRLATIAIAVGILAGALGIRLARLDRIVTPDEPLWITRSARFADAVAEGRFEDTFQAVHPGVTLMWLGVIAYGYFDPQIPVLVQARSTGLLQASVHTVLEPDGINALDVLVELRRVAIVANVLLLALAGWMLGRATTWGTALLAGVLVAADPFQIALSRLLHLDALAAGLLLAGVLALLRYRQTDRFSYLALAAVLTALGWLTRSSGFILGPWTLAVLSWPLLDAIRRTRRVDPVLIRGVALRGAAWGAIALLTTVVVWPALWVAPTSTLETYLKGTFSLASVAHQKQIFFRGEVGLDDPGWSFYPISMVWRTTPLVLLGVAFAALGAALPGRHRLPEPMRQTARHLTLFGIAYLVMLSFGAKKIDRYVLPDLVIADVVAGIGWGWLVSQAVGRVEWPGPRRLLPAVAWGTTVAVAVAQIGLAVASAPYYFSYYNPALGGLAAAEDVMMIGWGEGFDQVGAWLNAQEGGPALRVTAGPWPNALDYYFVGDVAQRDHLDPGGQVREWLTTDYAVVFFGEIQRGLIGRAFLDAVGQLEPAATFRVEGRDMFWIYDLRGQPLPDEVYASSPSALAWPSGLRLLDSMPGNRDFAAGTSVGLTLWLQLPEVPPDDVEFEAVLVHPATGERYATTIAVPSGADSDGLALATGRIKVPATATTGVYAICVKAISADGTVLRGRSPHGATAQEDACGGSVEVLPPGQDDREPPPWRLEGRIGGWSTPEERTPGIRAGLG
jgi:hypothetical protein